MCTSINFPHSREVTTTLLLLLPPLLCCSRSCTTNLLQPLALAPSSRSAQKHLWSPNSSSSSSRRLERSDLQHRPLVLRRSTWPVHLARQHTYPSRLCSSFHPSNWQHRCLPFLLLLQQEQQVEGLAGRLSRLQGSQRCLALLQWLLVVACGSCLEAAAVACSAAGCQAQVGWQLWAWLATLYLLRQPRRWERCSIARALFRTPSAAQRGTCMGCHVWALALPHSLLQSSFWPQLRLLCWAAAACRRLSR